MPEASVRLAAVTDALAEARRLESAGRLDEAEAAYRRQLKDQPHNLAALNLLGLLCHRRGRHGEAAEIIGGALVLNPADAEALANLGAVQAALGDRAAAIASFRRVAELLPDDARTWRNLALALQEGGDVAGAIEAHRRAISLDPDQLQDLRRLGKALFVAGDFAAAARAYAQAAKTEPASADNWSDLGAARHRSGNLAGARIDLQEAVRLDPHHAAAWCNLGALENDSGDDQRAITSFTRAIAAEPDHVDSHVFRGASLLRRGRFAEGWADYEWRLRQRRGPRVDRGFDQPRWRGESFAGRRLLIHAEQGLGDTIQFMRYLPLVQARGGEVIFEVQASLRRLTAASPLVGDVNVITGGEALPPFDLYCPLLSLPAIFGTDLATIPGGIPYLLGDPSLAPALRPRRRPRRWAVAWAGNPRHPADRLRSLPGQALDSLAKLTDVEFVSLQVGSVPRPAKLPLVDAAPLLTDFAVTAAILDDIDLVVSVDTAVAHLAGAMGKPTWVLLPHVADWRWLVDRDDSPWYPSLRLFRQSRPGDWTTVLDRLADEAVPGG